MPLSRQEFSIIRSENKRPDNYSGLRTLRPMESRISQKLSWGFRRGVRGFPRETIRLKGTLAAVAHGDACWRLLCDAISTYAK